MLAEPEFLVFGGSASRRLAQAVADYLGTPLAQGETLRFSEGNLFVRVLDNVRGQDVFLIQGTAFPANDNFMELLFWIDALKRASAASVTAVVPYFSYAKGDKKDEPRVSIRARVCADAIEAAGVDRVVTLDLHAPQVQGFFKVPVDDLYAMPVLCDAVASKGLRDLVVVSPDAGFAKKAPVGRPPPVAARHRREATGRPLRVRRGSRAHRLGRGPDRTDRRRLHDLGRDPLRRRSRARRARCHDGVRGGQPRPPGRIRDRAAR
jgi:ribose-phosphate pyrophosphokinase